MDLLSTGPTALASIVGLLGQFVGERRTAAAHGYEEFTAWLATNRHEDVIRLLEQNAATVVGIKAVLAQDRATLLQRLDQLDYQLAVITSLVQGFTGLAQAIRPGVRLSTEALTFLREVDRSGASQVIEFNAHMGRLLVALDSTSGANAPIDYGDPRFFEDDVRQLIDAELLRLSHDEHGHRVFHFTRQAAQLVQSLNGAE